MKKLLLLSAIAPLLISTACSSDDADHTPVEQVFSKVITYEPEFLNYTKKRIQYYNASYAIIADTTFNNSGAWTQRVVRTLNGNVKTTLTYNSQNAIIKTATEEYDGSGRLISTSGDYNTLFTYNADGTITATSTVNNVAYHKFSKNSNGLIYNRLQINDNTNVSLGFQNQLPVTYLNDGQITGNFSYYPNPMPAPLLKSVTEMNNTILRAYRLEHLPSNCNSYLNNWLGLNRFEREFNSDNYQVHSKSFSIDVNVTPNTGDFGKFLLL